MKSHSRFITVRAVKDGKRWGQAFDSAIVRLAGASFPFFRSQTGRSGRRPFERKIRAPASQRLTAHLSGGAIRGIRDQRSGVRDQKSVDRFDHTNHEITPKAIHEITQNRPEQRRSPLSHEGHEERRAPLAKTFTWTLVLHSFLCQRMWPSRRSRRSSMRFGENV
jgi:hypothetical protein